MKNKRFIRFASLIAVFGLLAAAGFGQAYRGQGRMKGVVIDDQGNPVEGVKVKLYHPKSDSGFETKTDAKGRWEALWIRGGAWNIDFSKPGYETKKIYTEVSEGGKIIPVETKVKKIQGLVLTEDLMGELDRGNGLFDQGKVDEALTVYQKLLQINPDAYVINYSIGNCYFKKEDYDQAIAYYQKVLDKNPEYLKALIGMGNAYTNKNDIDKAMEYYSKIDLSKIDDVDVLYNIGISYYKNGKPAEALKYFQRSVELKSDYTDGLYYLGLTCLNLQDNAAALTAFDNYLKADPDSERAGQVKGFIEYLRKK